MCVSRRRPQVDAFLSVTRGSCEPTLMRSQHQPRAPRTGHAARSLAGPEPRQHQPRAGPRAADRHRRRSCHAQRLLVAVERHLEARLRARQPPRLRSSAPLRAPVMNSSILSPRRRCHRRITGGRRHNEELVEWWRVLRLSVSPSTVCDVGVPSVLDFWWWTGSLGLGARGWSSNPRTDPSSRWRSESPASQFGVAGGAIPRVMKSSPPSKRSGNHRRWWPLGS